MNYEECEAYLKAHEAELTVGQLGNLIGIMGVLIEANQEIKYAIGNHICDLRTDSITEAEKAEYDGKLMAYGACRNAVLDLYTDYISCICFGLGEKKGTGNGKKKPGRKDVRYPRKNSGRDKADF